MIGIEPEQPDVFCFTDPMTQLAEPAALVVPVQLCAADPVPRVKVTVLPGSGLP